MKKLFPILTLLLLNGCFSENYNKPLTGDYYYVYSEDRLRASVMEKCDGGYGGNIEQGVYYVEWNDDFIIAKQHPSSRTLVFIQSNIKEQKDSIHCYNKPLFPYPDNSEQVVDSLVKIAKVEQNDQHTSDTPVKIITLYYIIDLKNKVKKTNYYGDTILVDETYIAYNVMALEMLRNKLKVPKSLPNSIYVEEFDK